MIPHIPSTKPIDMVINQTAADLVSYVCPKILLIGEWDEYFGNITQHFQWAEYRQKLSLTFEPDIAVIVINKRAYLQQIAKRVSKNTVILVYDEEDTIPVSERNLSSPNIICYLKSISERYIRGHIRTLLQLRKCLVTIDNQLPYFITQEIDRHCIYNIVRTLDKGVPCYVQTPNPSYFYTVFTPSVKMSHYESSMFVDRPDQFDMLIDSDPTTAMLHVRSKNDFAAYNSCSLDRFSHIFISDSSEHFPQDVDVSLAPSIGYSKETYYLSAYYLSLKMNLIDEEHRTRFIQMGDINKLMKQYSQFPDFITSVKKAFTDHSLKFRNIPIRIHDMYFCNYPLHDLVEQFERAVHNELLSVSSNSFELAELVSGTNRITLTNRFGDD